MSAKKFVQACKRAAAEAVAISMRRCPKRRPSGRICGNLLGQDREWTSEIECGPICGRCHAEEVAEIAGAETQEVANA
jgi:hypothetical protein